MNKEELKKICDLYADHINKKKHFLPGWGPFRWDYFLIWGNLRGIDVNLLLLAFDFFLRNYARVEE